MDTLRTGHPLRRRTVAVAIVVAGLAACGGRDELWTEALETLGPVTAGGRFALVEATTARLVAVDPADDGPPASLTLSPLPRSVAATASEVLVLGGRGDAPTLDRVRLPELELRTVDLPAPYDRAAVSPDGRFAVLHFDPSIPPAPGGPAARSQDEVGVLALEGGAVHRVPLRSESLAPSAVVFSPDATLAAVVLDGAVVLIELAAPDANVRVPMKLSSGVELTALEALFSSDGAFLFVRTASSDDVVAVELVRGPGPELGAAINFLSVPGGEDLADIVVPSGEGLERTVAAVFRGGDAKLALLDATGDVARTRVASLAFPAARLADLGDGRLLAYGLPSTFVSLSARAVAAWVPLQNRLTEDLLPDEAAAEPLIGGGAAYFEHATFLDGGSTGAAGLTRLTLDDDGARLRITLTPVVLAGAPTAGLLLPETGRLLLGVERSREESGAAPDYESLDHDASEGSRTGALVSIEAPAGDDAVLVDGVALDDPIVALGLVGDRLWALHAGTLGDVTFLPVNALRREEAVRYDGLLLTGLLDAVQED